MSFAAQTKVPIERTKVEIERLVMKYGADQYVTGWSTVDPPRATVQFRMADRYVRFVITLPITTSRRPAEIQRVEQRQRARWRALMLVIKAKLEAVASHIETFDEAFLAQIVMPNGQTVADTLVPQLAEAYKDGAMPKLLTGV